MQPLRLHVVPLASPPSLLPEPGTSTCMALMLYLRRCMTCRVRLHAVKKAIAPSYLAPCRLAHACLRLFRFVDWCHRALPRGAVRRGSVRWGAVWCGAVWGGGWAGLGVRPETQELLAGVESHHPPFLTDVSSTKIRDASAEDVSVPFARGGGQRGCCRTAVLRPRGDASFLASKTR